MAVTLTAHVELFKTKPSSDISSIEDSAPEGTRPELYLDLIRKQADKIKSKFKLVAREGRYHLSTKAGPNGPVAMMSAWLDAIHISRNKDLMDLFSEGSTVFGRTDLLEYIQKFLSGIQEKGLIPTKDKLHTAKLLFLPDKAMKTRVVYCLNWWFQELLEETHRSLYKLLETIPQDGTSSHDRAASTVKQWTADGKKLWSIDLTSATDRFPKVLQVEVIRSLLGEHWSNVWDRIMSIPAWSDKHNRYITYSVGQPMGAKTSWACFALTHHCLIRALCAECDREDNPYVIIGDDIVIADDKVAERYIQALNTLGVPYSPDKTIDPNGTKESVAEFAKRLFRNGSEVSPITPALLHNIFGERSYVLFPTLVEEMNRKWDNSGSCELSQGHIGLLPPASRLFQLVPKEWKVRIAVLLTTFRVLVTQPDHVEKGSTQMLPSDCQVITNPWLEIGDEMVYLSALGAEVVSNCEKCLNSILELRKLLSQELPEKTQADRDLALIPGHPIQLALLRLEEVSKNAMRKYSNSEMTLADVYDLGADIQYLRVLFAEGLSYSQWRSRKVRRSEKKLQLMEKVLKDALAIKNGTSDLYSADADQWW